jgi:large subunit ribosomal protein L15
MDPCVLVATARDLEKCWRSSNSCCSSPSYPCPDQQTTSHSTANMPLQLCRAVLARGRHAIRSAPSFNRSISSQEVINATTSADSTPTTPTPDTFKISDAESSGVARSSGERAPRWSQTPAGMKAPMQLDHAKSSHNKIWLVNSNPERLDAMYVRLLGPRGDKVLPEELKWLAVTHKSFDQGRRGFNDRLAMMGTILLPSSPRGLAFGCAGA